MSEPARESKSNRCDQGLENIPKFLKILYQLLEDKSQNDYISWSHDGRAIAIKNPTEFAEKILPVYFKHSNYSSFVRQLNLYSFRKKKHYTFDNTFAHPMFLKGRKDLLKNIKRKNSHANNFPEREGLKIDGCVYSDSEFTGMADQNTCLRVVHQEMLEKIESLERALGELNEKNHNLRRHYQRKKQNEDFLKKVVNKMAKVHGTGPIREIIESLALDGIGHNLHLKPAPLSELELEGVHSRQQSCSLDKHDIHLDSSPHLFQGCEQDNERNSITQSNFALSVPHLRTISSLSTNPDLNHLHTLYEGFDQEMIDTRSSRQSNLASGGMLKSFKSGFEDFSFSGDSRRDCLI